MSVSEALSRALCSQEHMSTVRAMHLNSLATGNIARKLLIDLTTCWHTVVERICCFKQYIPAHTYEGYMAVQEEIHFHHAVARHLLSSILQFMQFFSTNPEGHRRSLDSDLILPGVTHAFSIGTPDLRRNSSMDLDVPSDGDICLHPANANERITWSTIDCRISTWDLRTL